MKKIYYFLVLTLYSLPLAAQAADPFGIFDVAKYSLPTGKPSPSLVIASVINTVLSVLGVIALVMIVVAGFQWMTAAGNEEKVTNAKKILTGAIIGLVIVMGSLVIVKFIITNIQQSLNPGVQVNVCRTNNTTCVGSGLCIPPDVEVSWPGCTGSEVCCQDN